MSPNGPANKRPRIAKRKFAGLFESQGEAVSLVGQAFRLQTRIMPGECFVCLQIAYRILGHNPGRKRVEKGQLALRPVVRLRRVLQRRAVLAVPKYYESLSGLRNAIFECIKHAKWRGNAIAHRLKFVQQLFNKGVVCAQGHSGHIFKDKILRAKLLNKPTVLKNKPVPGVFQLTVADL